ncbi:hypothetical protein N802_05530 [Knoellia sinensis KCTC 19936]|uniref:Glutamine--scyllo-inositol aminotransferase n=1 Tax=Knoellia sinensis KCTC 19936 TaxID=1385520 RepID=A0A0A0J5F8_9MICO|nr:DegT/DnrJ/EryC1/StrS family aminotransferase [Knoellia sinensis]KGN30856.1 hypothetical protein N802_05530 [Knoellia sinensis KCTC 19936]
MTEALAIAGGTPTLSSPLTPRTPFPPEALDLITEAVGSGVLFGPTGPLTQRFEGEFAELTRTAHAVTVSSGTAAVHTAIAALDPAPGSEVITAPITDAGSVAPLLFQGCVPRFADVDEHLSMTVESVRSLINDRTAAILAVHPFGGACDAPALRELADGAGIALIEDCSQAYGTTIDGRHVGSFGSIGVFSLQQSKHITAGEGGVCVTSDPGLDNRMRLFRDKGWDRSTSGARSYPSLGLNYRASELVAALAIPQLPILGGRITVRRRHAATLDSGVTQIRGLKPWTPAPRVHASYWAYPFMVEGGRRDEWAAALLAEGVPTSPGYTGAEIHQCMAALHEAGTFGGTRYPLDLVEPAATYSSDLTPSARAMLEKLLVFWLHEDLPDEQVALVAAALRKVGAALLPPSTH